MKLRILAALQLFASLACAQDILTTPVTVTFNNLSVEKCIQKVEQSSTISFSYNSKEVAEIEKKITASFKDQPLEQVLKTIFQGTNFAFKEIGGQITVYKSVPKSGEKITLSGYVRVAGSREEIIGARVYFADLGIGCVTNVYGYYSLDLPAGRHAYTVSSLGMKPLRGDVEIAGSMVLNFSLQENTIELRTVSISSHDSIGKNSIPTDLSNPEKTVLTQQSVLRLPAPNGEPDLLKFLQQFPGVQSSHNGGANYQVRGAGTGNNLILIDEIPIYHPTHMMGAYSIINIDAVKSAELYKDYIPARFGSRNASVLQINTKEGDLQKYHLHGAVSFANARVNVEGPIIKNRASFYLSGRRSVLPTIAYQILSPFTFSLPKFFDLNSKVNVHINSNNRLYFTGYLGKDELADTSGTFNWGNLAGGIRWNHIIDSKRFSNLSLTHSDFNYRFKSYPTYIYANDYGQKVSTDKINYSVTHFYSNKVRLDYGAELMWIKTSDINRIDQEANLFLQRSAFETAIFASADYKISSRLNIKAGVRIPVFFHLGTQDTTSYVRPDLSYVQVIYEKNKIYDPNFFIDPRILLTYYVTEFDRLFFSVNVASQNTHVVNYVNYFLPVEIWTTSSGYLQPQRSYSESVGWVHQHDYFESSVTIFNRNVFNVIDYASPGYISSQDIESNLLSGNMHSAGVEFQFNFRKSNRYQASVSYTFMKSTQFVEGINKNKPYPTANSRPHSASFSQYIVASKKWGIGTNLIWHSGGAITLPNGQFIVGETVFPLYSENRNAERLPYFCRLDLSFYRKLGIKKKRDHFDLVINFTNVLMRHNHSNTYVESDSFENKLMVKSIDYTPFNISISLNYRF